MSSTETPYGFLPVNLTGGRSYSGSVRLMRIASGYNTSIFFGDAVKVVAAGTVEKDAGTDAMTPVGIFLGCEYTQAATNYFLHDQHWPADTVASDARAYVCDDPDAIFQIQSDESVAVAAIGANAAIVQGAGSTTTGKSGVQLDGSSVNTTNTLPVRIIDIVDNPNNAAGDAYTDVLVRWNVGHAYRTTTGI